MIEEKYPSPLPLYKTPFWLRWFGFPTWRYLKMVSGRLRWQYLPNREYYRLFVEKK
ncbi:hypothetical protein EVB91_208 [Rhizobium phage RHph_I1_18]|nr:hypothetical protein EVB91_208 [Rhizobium phage RHph_I1_18]